MQHLHALIHSAPMSNAEILVLFLQPPRTAYQCINYGDFTPTNLIKIIT